MRKNKKEGKKDVAQTEAKRKREGEQVSGQSSPS